MPHWLRVKWAKFASQVAKPHIDYAARTLRVDHAELKEGDWISLDGSTGEVIKGEIPTLPSEVLQVLVSQIHGSQPIAGLPTICQADALG